MARKGSTGPAEFGIDVVRVLKGIMQQRNISQISIARQIAISPSQISRILSYEKEMTLDQFECFCAAIDEDPVSILDISTGEEVWGDLSAHYVQGYLVAASPYDDQERFFIRRDHPLYGGSSTQEHFRFLTE